jgi:hypothetical protein
MPKIDPQTDKEKLNEGNKAFPGSSTFGGPGQKGSEGKGDTEQNGHAHVAGGYKSPNLGSSSVLMDQDEASAMKNKESGATEKTDKTDKTEKKA